MVVDSDDNDDLIDYLRACGFRVTSVRTAPMVLKRVLSEAPSVILLDLMSPRRDGLRLCRDLRQNHASGHIPIIMVTAERDESDKIVALELGADDYLNKPCNFHELTLRIERALDRAAAREQMTHCQP